MPVPVEPTFNCLAVRNPWEMGPHREPGRRRSERRGPHGEARARRSERRAWGTGSTRRPPARRTPRRSRMLIVGESSRWRLDHVAVVAGVGVLAGVLASLAARF